MKLLSNIALSFQGVESFDKDMNEILKKIGTHIDLSRIYIFVNKNGNALNKTFEWSNEEIVSNVKSVVAYPLPINNNVYGFIGFYDCKYKRIWKEEELEMFSTLSKVISNAYKSKYLRERILNSEANLRNIFEMFSKTFEKNPLPMSINNIENKSFIKVNSAFLEKTGYSKEDIIGKNIEEIDLFTDFSKMKDIRDKNISGQDVRDEEISIRRKDGKLLKCIFSIEDIIIQNKKYFLAVIVDITSRKQAEIELKESEERFMLALDQAKAGLWDMDMETGNTYFSPMLKKILGYEDDEIRNNFKELQYGSSLDDREKLKKAREDYLSGKTDHYEVKHRLKHKDGKWRWILTRGGILRDENGVPKRWIGTNIDITVEHEQSLELERFFSVNLDLLCITDTEGRFIKVNTAWEAILGYSSKEIEGENFKRFIHPDDIASTVEVFEKLKRDGKVETFINRYRSSDGQYHYIEWKANLYEDTIYVAARNVTERIKYEKKILDISNRDVLTNIYNRRYIYKRVKEIIEEYKRNDLAFSVCILDIDEFKEINDTYGHHIGDCVLKEFTKKIESKLRPYDLLGRYGGEEFIIILKNTDIEFSNLTVERISKNIKNTNFRFDDININLTFSAGISSSNEFEKETLSIDDLIRLADQRMYKAKNRGRNKIVIK